MLAKALELKHTITLIGALDNEIKEIEFAIKAIMDKINFPILSIPGISYRMGAMIIAEIGDFERFSTPDKILAYAGLSPSISIRSAFVYLCTYRKTRLSLLKICSI